MPPEELVGAKSCDCHAEWLGTRCQNIEGLRRVTRRYGGRRGKK